MLRKLNYLWRLFATGLSFAIFGLGGLLLSLVIMPGIHLVSFNRDRAHRACQYLVHQSFGAFIWMMQTLGIMTYEIEGADKIRGKTDSVLVVANHPSLIDVIFLISLLPNTLCVVKKAIWSNPFMAGIMWCTGYIPNAEPETLITSCVDSLKAGHSLVVFPEGTRTIPNKPVKFKRGAARIILNSRRAFTPIKITSTPTTLTKAEKWYEIPPRKFHFSLSVGDSVDPDLVVDESMDEVKASRKLNFYLETLFA